MFVRPLQTNMKKQILFIRRLYVVVFFNCFVVIEMDFQQEQKNNKAKQFLKQHVTQRKKKNETKTSCLLDILISFQI